MPTREQERAQKAFAAVSSRRSQDKEIDYKRFSKSFPALIQTCGLAQAIAFAVAKEQQIYIGDIASVAGFRDGEEMARLSREAAVPLYQKHSREALAAATWIKRYSEALLKGDD